MTYRNPALVAKITTTLDVISGGRAVLGIGAAWFEAEHQRLRVRLPAAEGALRAARGRAEHHPHDVHRRTSATYAGKHFHVDGAFNNPKPLRGDIPILIGGSGERKTLRFVAKYADGSNLFGDVDRVKHLLGVLEGHCEDVGRDPAEITKTRMGTVYIAPTHEDAVAKLEAAAAKAADPGRARATAFVGDPDEIAEQVQAYLDAGLDGITFSMPDVLRHRDGQARRRDPRGGDRDSHRVITPDDVLRIAAIRSPVLRNLEITYAYSLLAAAVAERVGSERELVHVRHLGLAPGRPHDPRRGRDRLRHGPARPRTRPAAPAAVLRALAAAARAVRSARRAWGG